MFEDYDFVVPRDEKGISKRTILRTVRTGEEEVLIIGVKDIESKVTTRQNADFEVITVSSVFLNSEYNVGLVSSKFCDNKELFPVNSIECIQVIQGDKQVMNIENGFDDNNQLTCGFARIDGSTGPLNYSYSVNHEGNIYPFENVRVNDQVKNFLGLYFNPETREFHNGEMNNTNHR